MTDYDDGPRDELVDDVELSWVEAHWGELIASYPGEWIAVIGQQLMGHSLTITDLLDMHLDRPFVTKVPLNDEPLNFVGSSYPCPPMQWGDLFVVVCIAAAVLYVLVVQ